ncbi:hypothetical protein FRC03_000089 [Tulasnella sp. 419]|nr:hypothetical protein FRC03_000089 [Tulasnella sp. 419]
MVFPTCETVSQSTGVGTNCHLNIVYNKQKPLCSTSTPTITNRNCRLPDDLCTPDPDFSFNFDASTDNQYYSRFALSSLLPNINTPSLLLYDTTHSPPLPNPLRIGDIDLDGFPDILAVVAHNPHGGILGMNQVYDTTPFLFHSNPCGGQQGCSPNKRAFELVSKHVEPLQDIKDARGAAFLDIDEDGTLDILVQRTGKQEDAGTKVTFIQNNFFHDAFFLKAIVLNGACSGWCYPANGSEPRYHPFGVSYSGASYKYTILDTSGRRSAAQVAQLPQTAYQALLTPYSFFGLGRTNNYIENLFVGSTKHSEEHYINMEGVIPNSKVVIMPTQEGDDGMWRRELYLRPGEWIPWVTLTVAVATFILAGIVFMLHLSEKREDEMERRRALHHINFDAL